MTDTAQMPYPAVVILVGEILQGIFDSLIALLLMRWLLGLFTTPATMTVEVGIE